MSRLAHYLNRSQATTFGLAVLILFLAPAVSKATLLNYFSSALPQSSGTSTWSGTGVTTTTPANVDIYYAVFRRTTFESLFGVNLPTTGVGGSDAFVYPYQVDNAENTATIKKLTIGLLAPVYARNQGQISDLDPNDEPSQGTGTLPSSFSINTTSAIWNYSGTTGTIPANGKSTLLYFTSPCTPVDGKNAGVLSGFSGSSALVPTPVPEPSTLILALLGLCAVVSRPVRSMFS